MSYSRKIAAPREEIWRPYEQAAYMLDGMVRLSQLVDQFRREWGVKLDVFH